MQPLVPGAVLEYRSPTIVAATATITPGPAARDTVRAAMDVIQARVVPVYSINERRASSAVLRRGAGSCSQRFGLLESLSRALGIRTRVEGLTVSGEFWRPRFPVVRSLIPQVVVIPWPQFYLETGWVPIDHIVPPQESDTAFAATDDNTLFEAAAEGTITRGVVCEAGCFSSYILGSLGVYAEREWLLNDSAAAVFPAGVRQAAEAFLATRSRLRRGARPRPLANRPNHRKTLSGGPTAR